MSKFNYLQSSFAGGMVSDKLNGRSDLDIYKCAYEEMINLYPSSCGGAKTREPFYLSKLLPTPSGGLIEKLTLIPFTDSQGNLYIINCIYQGTPNNSFYFEIFGSTDNGVTWNTVTFTYTSTIAYDTVITTQNLQWCYIGDSVVITSGVFLPLIFHRRNLSTSGFILSTLDNYVSDVSNVATKTYINDSINAMFYPQLPKNTNPNYLLNGTYKTTSNHPVWELSFVNDAGTLLTNAWNVNLNTYITVTNSTFTAIFATRGGDANNTTSSIRANLIYVRGTPDLTYTSSSAQKTIMREWYISPWDNINGYPKTVGYFGGRLILGATDKFPSSMWASRLNTIYRFNLLKLTEDASSDTSGLNTNIDATSDTSAFDFVQGSGGSFQKIQWLRSGTNGLYVGTTGGIELHTSGNNGAFKAGNIYPTTLSNEGCNSCMPVVFSGSLIYATKDGSRLIMISSDGKMVDLTTLYGRLDNADFGYFNADTYKRLVVDESKNSIYILTSLGKLIILRLNTLENKWGFCDADTDFLTNTTSYDKTDICLISNFTTQSLVLRTNYKDTSNTYRHVLLRQEDSKEDNIKDGSIACVDCRSIIAGSTLKVLTLPAALQRSSFDLGVWYETADHKWYFEKFTTGTFTTTVTLAKEAIYAYAGFYYFQRIKSLDLEAGGSTYGTGIGSIKRIDNIGFRVWNTYGFYFGSDSTTGETVTLSADTDTTLKTSVFEKPFTASPDRGTHVIIEVRTCSPLYISALVYKGLTSE